MINHPCYLLTKLETYIGSPILDDDGTTIGTVNFSSDEPRKNKFSEAEVTMVEALAKALKSWAQETKKEPAISGSFFIYHRTRLKSTDHLYVCCD